MAAIIERVVAGSIAEEVELLPQDELISINGKKPLDFIEYKFLITDEEVILLFSRENELFEVEIEKDESEDLGIVFVSDTFDREKHCHNSCIFCFEEQMPKNMRSALSAKDDDYRLSFLHGNFITLTNMNNADFTRIYRDHLSPLYISVHAADDELRRAMLRNFKAPPIIPRLQEMIENSIELHTQIVLCPNINDGENLLYTLEKLHEIKVRSIGVVPVGLTDHREGKYPLTLFSEKGCEDVVQLFESFLQNSPKRDDEYEYYLADEFYLRSGIELPLYESYKNFYQYENGIGMTRNFLKETENISGDLEGATLITGKLFYPILKNVAKKINAEVLAVENSFYGKNITVAGLLTGKDIVKALQKKPKFGKIIIPAACFNADGLTLDDMTISDIVSKTNRDVRACASLKELF